MEASYVFLEVIKYTLPSIVAFIAVFLIQKQFFEQQWQKSQLEIRRLNQQSITPTRLQAYERVVLLLDRISPNHLVMRLNKPGLEAKQFQSQLIQNIRSEYEHNLTQQIYMSRGAWEAVKKAKEESVKLINIAATKVPGDAPAIELSKTILELAMEIEELPTQKAIDLIKREARTIY